jgi:hypothetical protein
MDKVGPEAVIDLAQMGVKSEIPLQPSIALGAVEITVERYGCSLQHFCQSRCLYETIYI